MNTRALYRPLSERVSPCFRSQGKNLANFDRLSVVAPHNFTINQPGYICTRAKTITPTVFQINSQRSGQAFRERPTRARALYP